jgi:hypothetical protein
MKQISYLKSFKIQEDNDDDDPNESTLESDDDGSHSDDTDSYDEKEARAKAITRLRETSAKRKSRSYFHYIKYAIQNASPHVNMKPCYGFDITPSSGHFLDFTNMDFIETSLPVIRQPQNDFHTHLLRLV